MDDNTKITVERHEKTELNFNRPAKFKVTFISGTSIEGTITPNNPLIVYLTDDVQSFDITIGEESRPILMPTS